MRHVIADFDAGPKSASGELTSFRLLSSDRLPKSYLNVDDGHPDVPG